MPASAPGPDPHTTASRLLRRLRDNGVAYLFANAGTDFPPIVEALAHDPAAAPAPIVCPHENAAVSMAHGYAMVTRQPQAVMVHVNVGTANAVCGLLNAERERVPMLMMAGRTPISESGPAGRRSLNIHWAQEMFDQAGLVREAVRWDYELRDPAMVDAVIDRALAIAQSAPRGPVYLSLPRETLAAEVAAGSDKPPRFMPAASAPDADAIDRAAAVLKQAEAPVLITASAGRDPAAVPVLVDFADRHAIPVVEYRPRYLNLPGDHPMHAGFESAPALKEADAVVVLDCDVPWIPAFGGPDDAAPVISIGEDPLFARYPVRGFPSDVTIAAPPAGALQMLSDALPAGGAADARRDRLARANQDRRAQERRAIEPARNGVMTFGWASRCLGEAAARAVGDTAIYVNEYPLVRSAFDIVASGGFFGSSPSGGLGWGLPAALGARLAAPDRLVIAALGDGSHIFANPVACHQIASAYGLAILTVVFNNGAWAAVDRATRAMYPEGAAVAANQMPLTALTPAPKFETVVEACGGWGCRVEDPDALPGALDQAIEQVMGHGRQALVNVIARA